MVASRKPKHAPKPHRETLEEKFQRVLAEPVGAPVKMTKREARFFARRLWESGDPSTPTGDEVIRKFYGACECDACSGEGRAAR
jgi:hypothetical protein